MNRRATKATLPQWAADILAAVPRSGEGFHSWLFRGARALWKCGREGDDICEILQNAAATCGRYVPAREIEDAVRNSRASVFQPASAYRQPWPSVNAEQREAVIATGFGLVDLWEMSPIRFEESAAHTEEIVDALFLGNPWLCVGVSKSDFKTRRREELRGELSALALIVPSPMTARTGHTQDGKESEHSLENTGARRFLVIEQDGGTIDEQAAILQHLAERAPLALAVHSGSKSLHGWFCCAGVAEEKVSRFFRNAAALGADPALWTRSQLTRMPDGLRGNGNRQTVYFFNPEVIR
jgi:hypothetical protein